MKSHLVLNYVTEQFIRSGKGSTTKEIAKALCFSYSTTNKILDSLYYSLGSHKEERPSYSRDYPTMQSGYHLTNVWEPTKVHLTTVIRDMRKETEATL